MLCSQGTGETPLTDPTWGDCPPPCGGTLPAPSYCSSCLWPSDWPLENPEPQALLVMNLVPRPLLVPHCRKESLLQVISLKLPALSKSGSQGARTPL